MTFFTKHLTKQYRPLKRSFFILSLCALQACGGGGNNNNDSTTGNTLTLIDSAPNQSTTTAESPRFYLSHLSTDSQSYTLSAPCNTRTHITHREPDDLSSSADLQLLEYFIRCNNNLALGSPHTLTITEDAPGNQSTSMSFSSAAAVIPNNNKVVVLDESTLPFNSIGTVTPLTLLDAIIDELSLPPAVELVLDVILEDIADDDLPHLFNPVTEYDVLAQTVRYDSLDPHGGQTQALSGLVAFPDVSGVSGFTPKDEIILLTHSTGSVPSEQSSSGLWYNLAIILASRGYLVVAPDNYGAGETSAEVQTYLQARATGSNAVDLVTAVIDSAHYDDVIHSGAEKDLAIIGYSQGGHTAIAAWQEVLHNHQGTLKTTRLFSGAGPYNVYDTFKGVVNYANGTCFFDEYCRYINDELVGSYIIDRILPPLFSYADTQLEESDVVNGRELNPDFALGFALNNAEYDQLKLLLQLSSFTNISNPETTFNDPEMDMYFYHSDYDRLVVQANTEEFTDTIDGYVESIEDRSERCNSSNMQLLFAATTEVGVIHGICGAIMIDDVLDIFD